MSSIRSLFLPGAAIVRDRSRIVGAPSRAKARACSRNGPSRRTAGFAASTNGSTSSSAARRFTKVVFARRMNGGSRSTDSASADCWRPSAPKVPFRLRTTPVRSSRRSASAFTSVPESTRKRSSSGVVAGQLLEQAGAGAERRVQVVHSAAQLLALAVQHRGGALEEVLEPRAGALVEEVEDLVELDRGGGLVRADRAAVRRSRRRSRGRASGRCTGWRCRTATPA